MGLIPTDGELSKIPQEDHIYNKSALSSYWIALSLRLIRSRDMEIYPKTLELASERQNRRPELTESRQEPSREGTIHDRHKVAANVKAIHQRCVGLWIE
jgi:hypothetical protein